MLRVALNEYSSDNVHKCFHKLTEPNLVLYNFFFSKPTLAPHFLLRDQVIVYTNNEKNKKTFRQQQRESFKQCNQLFTDITNLNLIKSVQIFYSCNTRE